MSIYDMRTVKLFTTCVPCRFPFSYLSFMELQHPFAMGITLAKLTAVTVDGQWKPTYLDGYQQSIHKVGDGNWFLSR